MADSSTPSSQIPSLDDLPEITVATIDEMSVEAFEAFLAEMDADNRPRIIRDEVGGKDAVLVPIAVYNEMCEITGREPIPQDEESRAKRVPYDGSDERFSEVFRSLRGKLKDIPGLDV